MALAAIDECVRNLVCVGADPSRIAILDNFCWPSCDKPQNMAALVRACEGCYDGAKAYRTPFVSGKDSLNNQLRYTDPTTGEKKVIEIPYTLLITGSHVEQEVAHVPILHHVVLALDPHLARFLDRLLALVLLEVGDRVDLGPDEARSKSVWITPAACGAVRRWDRPGADFLLAGGEVALQAQQVVRRVGDRRQRGLLHAPAPRASPAARRGAVCDSSLSILAQTGTTSAFLASSRAPAPSGSGLVAVQIVLVHVHHVEHLLAVMSPVA
jgi:hypothetical protein